MILLSVNTLKISENMKIVIAKKIMNRLLVEGVAVQGVGCPNKLVVRILAAHLDPVCSPILPNSLMEIFALFLSTASSSNRSSSSDLF